MPVEPENMREASALKLRIKFSKFGNMKFVGHLDFMRFFQRLIRKCKIPIRYSTGFSPHQIMSFAAPLGIGAEGLGEYMDIEVEDTFCLGEADTIALLRSQLYEGVEILSVRRLPEDAKKAMTLLSSADFFVYCKGDLPLEETLLRLQRALENWTAQKEIIVKKVKKEVTTFFDVKPFVFSLKASLREKNPGLFMHISQGSRNNIKPGMVLDSLAPFLPVEEFFSSPYTVCRLELYSEEGKTLESYGEPIE